MRLPRGFVLALTLAASLAGCGGSRGPDHDAERVQDAVRRSIDAENRADVAGFLALWTDDGLRSYDAGSRADLESGTARLGVEHTEVADFASTTVSGAKARVLVDTKVELGLYRLRFDLVRQGATWLLNGFQFLGPTPAPATAPVVEVKTVEYGYDVDPTALASGAFAVHLVNAGLEQHEISLLALPAGASAAEAVLALRQQSGRDVSSLPPGYQALGHLAFAPPGDGGVFMLAARLPPGHYAMVCFLPVGGLDELGNAKVPTAETHLARGMLAEFTVG